MVTYFEPNDNDRDEAWSDWAEGQIDWDDVDDDDDRSLEDIYISAIEPDFEDN